MEEEQKRFRTALKGTQEQLEAIKTRLSHGEHRLILKAQQMMLRDPDLIHQTETFIREELLNAEWAVARKLTDFADVVARAADSNDPHLVSRLTPRRGGHPRLWSRRTRRPCG